MFAIVAHNLWVIIRQNLVSPFWTYFAKNENENQGQKKRVREKEREKEAPICTTIALLVKPLF